MFPNMCEAFVILSSIISWCHTSSNLQHISCDLQHETISSGLFSHFSLVTTNAVLVIHARALQNSQMYDVDAATICNLLPPSWWLDCI